MKEKVKKIIFGYVPGFITGLIICGAASVIAATYFPSNQTIYDNSESGLQSTNVQDAIDELYGVCFPPYTPGVGTDVINQILDKKKDELYKDEHGDIRYYGATPNNYVSFNNELWRILGVIDGKIKIIRNESIGSKQWNSIENNNWNNASLKSYLNGDYYNSINETYKNMISEETYYLGGPGTSNLTASGYYDTERDSSQVYSGNPTSTVQYIGLMYPSDYGYAAGSSCLSTVLNNYDGSCKNSDYLSIGVTEWLQVPFVKLSNAAVALNSTGYVGTTYLVTFSLAVRPVLYLTSETQITGGDGSQGNAFKLG